MRTIRFHYSAGFVGSDGFTDEEHEDSITDDELSNTAYSIMEHELPEREAWWEEIKEDASGTE